FSIHTPDLLGHTWSLSLEEQFYLIWPPLFVLLFRIFKAKAAVFAGAVAIALFSWILRVVLFAGGAGHDRVYNGLDTHADALMLGCAVGLVFASRRVRSGAHLQLLK